MCASNSTKHYFVSDTHRADRHSKVQSNQVPQQAHARPFLLLHPFPAPTDVSGCTDKLVPTLSRKNVVQHPLRECSNDKGYNVLHLSSGAASRVELSHIHDKIPGG